MQVSVQIDRHFKGTIIVSYSCSYELIPFNLVSCFNLAFLQKLIINVRKILNDIQKS